MRIELTSLFCAVVLMASIPAAAQGAERTVVHAGHLLDVDSGKMLADQAVTMQASRVASVQPWSAAEIHAAMEEAAKRGRFVAAHAHGAEGIKRAASQFPSTNPGRVHT